LDKVNEVEVFWVVTPCCVVAGYQCFKDPRCLHLQGEHYTASQPRTTRLRTSPPWNP